MAARAAAVAKNCRSSAKERAKLNLISWAGYVEAAAGNPDWVTPFEEETGCKVNDKVAGTSDEMVKLMETGQYDGVSASGNATARLWAAHEVAPVNVSLVPNYKTVFADLKDQPYNTFEGVPYGIPHGRGANLLMWNKKDVTPGAELLGSHARTRRSRPNTRATSPSTTIRCRSPKARST